jgi:hypothetical protein
VFHQPVKHSKNPLIAGDGGYASVLRDEETGLVRLCEWLGTRQNNIVALGIKGRRASSPRLLECPKRTAGNFLAAALARWLRYRRTWWPCSPATLW